MEIKYFGWSSINLSSNGKELAFDPFYNNIYGTDWASINDYENIEAICLSHGHNEHFIDTPKIIDKTRATVIGPEELTIYLQNIEKVPENLLIPVDAGDEINEAGFNIKVFEWNHRIVSPSRYLRGDAQVGLNFATANALLTPKTTKFIGYIIETNEGQNIVNFSEGINPLFTKELLESLKKEVGKIDLLIGGIQLDFVNSVANIVGELKPKNCLFYNPHTMLFNALGLKTRPVKDFIDATKKILPKTNIQYLEPRDTYIFESQGTSL
jgi:metal-dependent hydrolase (beta-lactamase superfamily II)